MAKKGIDITKTGPAGFRQLQDANNDPFSDIRPHTISLFDINRQAQQDLYSPLGQQETRTGGQDYWGNSIFDNKSATEESFTQLGDIRAENQPWYSKMINGIGKAGVLAGTTVLEAVGLTYGIGQGIYNAIQEEGGIGSKAGAALHGLWDNPITRALHTINEYSEEFMPNYYTQDEIENPFSNIFTANFLGDKILKNFGFMVGAFYSGGLAAQGIGKVGQAIAKSAKLTTTAENTARAHKALGIAERIANEGLSEAETAKKLQAALKAANLTDVELGEATRAGLDRIRNIAQATRTTTQAVGSVGSAFNEGAIEAIQNSNDWAKQERMKENARYQQLLEAIQEEHEGTQEEALLLQKAGEDHEKMLAEIERSRARMGNADMLLNIPILTASNWLQLGKLYARGFDSTRREMGSIWNRFRLPGTLEKGNIHTSRNAKKNLINALVKGNTEGLEEYLQRAASDGAGNEVSEALDRWFTAGMSDKSKNDIDDFIVGFGKAVAENAGDPNAWEEYMIGAVSSLIGMPVFGSQVKNAHLKMGPVGLAGGLYGNIQDYREAQKHEKELADYLNGRINSGKAKELYDALRKNGDIDEALKGTLSEEDKKKYKDLEFEKIFNDINAAASTGHFSEYLEFIGYNKDYTDEELADIVEETTRTVTAKEQRKEDEEDKAILEKEIKRINKLSAKEKAEAGLPEYEEALKEVTERLNKNEYKDKKSGPFIQRVGDNFVGMNVNDPDKMREILAKNRDRLVETAKQYLRIRNAVDIESDGRLEDKDLNTLTMMRAKMWDRDIRSVEMAADVVHNLRKIDVDAESDIAEADAKVAKVQKIYDDAVKAVEQAESIKDPKKKPKLRELRELKQAVVKAEKALNNAKSVARSVKAFAELYDAVTKKKEATSAESRGIARVTSEGTSTRDANAEEIQAWVANINHMKSLALLVANSNLDNHTKTRVAGEIIDLNHLALERLEYNKKFREFMKDPSLINPIAQNAQDKLSKKEIDNKVRDLALQIKGVTSIAELYLLMEEERNANPELVEQALKKAKEDSSEDLKKLIDNYIEGYNFYNSFKKQAQKKLSGDIREGVVNAADESWLEAIESENEVNVKKAFINSLNITADDWEASGAPDSKEIAEGIRSTLNALEKGAASVATHKTAKKTSSSSEDEGPEKTVTKKATPDAAKKEEKKEGEEGKKGEEDEDTEEKLKEAVKEELREAIRKDKPVYTVAKLSEALRNRNEKLGDVLSDEYIAKITQEFLDAGIDNEEGRISHDESDMMDDSRNPISKRREEMMEARRKNFVSDMVSLFQYSLTYRAKFPVQDSNPVWQTVQKILRDKLAYQFLDKNYLGYVLSAAKERGLNVHFLKSTNETLNGEDVKGDKSVIFLAIEWTDRVESVIKEKAFNDNFSIRKGEFAPVKVGEKQYHIVGTLTYDKEAPQEVQDAFHALQSYINGVLEEPLMEEMLKDTPDEFVVMPGLTAPIKEIFTGRLEVDNSSEDTHDKKVSLLQLMENDQDDPLSGSDIEDPIPRRTSTEWSSGMEFYFGVVVNGSMNVHPALGADSRVDPNPKLMEKASNNGAIMLYLPKPDGKFYPIRCTRRTIQQFLDARDMSDGFTVDFLEKLNKNEYFKRIITHLNTLFDREASIGDRINAKVMLHKYFLMGSGNHIHVSEITGEVSLLFRDASEKVTAIPFAYDEPMDNILEFLNTLAEKGVKFSLPSPTMEEGLISGREVIEAEVFETGIRGFYNFGANFIIGPVDTKGNFIDVDEEVEVDGAGPLRGGKFTADLGNGAVTYLIDNGNVVRGDGSSMTDEEANKAVIIAAALQNPVSCKTFLLGDKASKTPDFMSEYNKVYIIHIGDEHWIYDPRVGEENKVFLLGKGTKETLVTTKAGDRFIKEFMDKSTNSGGLLKVFNASEDAGEKEEGEETKEGELESKKEKKKSGRKESKKEDVPSSETKGRFSSVEQKNIDTDTKDPVLKLLAGSAKKGVKSKILKKLQDAEASNAKIPNDSILATRIEECFKDSKKLDTLLDEVQGCNNH